MRKVFTSARCANRFGHKLNFSQGQFSYHFHPWSNYVISKSPSFAMQSRPVPSMTCPKSSWSNLMMRARSVLSRLKSILRIVLTNMRKRMVGILTTSAHIQKD